MDKFKVKGSNTPEGRLRKQEEKAKRAEEKRLREDALADMRTQAFLKSLDKKKEKNERLANKVVFA